MEEILVNLLRLVVYPIIYKGVLSTNHPKRWLGMGFFGTINGYHLRNLRRITIEVQLCRSPPTRNQAKPRGSTPGTPFGTPSALEKRESKSRKARKSFVDKRDDL